jgi:hypothetical protein
MKNDYKITSYYTPLQPTLEKFKITSGGQTVGIYKSYEEAAKLVVKLIHDPWYLDRGYTRADRSKS